MTRVVGSFVRFSAALCVGLVLAVPAGQVFSQIRSDSPKSQAIRPQREIDYALETEQLYRLTCDLKVELQKSGNDTLSIEAVKKVAEIERLVQRLNGEMKRK